MENMTVKIMGYLGHRILDTVSLINLAKVGFFNLQIHQSIQCFLNNFTQKVTDNGWHGCYIKYKLRKSGHVTGNSVPNTELRVCT